uniref:Uncharacterized protein n=1 Tax=Aegilops tauschii subsp. strangulata TaxID=200361 RepID=A0A453I1T6_AEGTS
MNLTSCSELSLYACQNSCFILNFGLEMWRSSVET